MGVRLEGRYESGRWVVGAGPKGPVDYDRYLPADMGGDPWHPEAWRPATTLAPPTATPFDPGRPCKWKACDFRLVPKLTEILSLANNLVPALTADYLAGTNGTLGLSGPATLGPRNVTAAAPAAASPNAAFFPLVALGFVAFVGTGYALYRVGNYYYGQRSAADRPGVPRLPEALPLQAV
jgi:hypothetical protein